MTNVDSIDDGSELLAPYAGLVEIGTCSVTPYAGLALNMESLNFVSEVVIWPSCLTVSLVILSTRISSFCEYRMHAYY